MTADVYFLLQTIINICKLNLNNLYRIKIGHCFPEMRKMFEQCNIWGWKDWSWNISDNVVCVRYQRRIQIKSISNFSTPEGSTLR